MYYNVKGEKIIYRNHAPVGKNSRLHIYLAGTTLPNPDYIVCHNERTPQELEWYQFEYVTAGKGYLEINGTTYTVTAGDMFFINRWTPNLYYTDKEQLLEKELITVSGSLIDRLVEVYQLHHSFLIRRVDAGDIFQKLHQALEQLPQTGREVAYAKTELLLHALIQLLADRQAEPCKEDASLAEAMLEYIHHHLEQQFTLEDMHRHFFLSKAQLIRVFRARYHMTPIQYTIMKRIETSMYFLEHSGLSIKMIAETLAFSDSKHYTKTFVRLTGMTPSHYRGQVTENRKNLLSQLMEQKGFKDLQPK